MIYRLIALDKIPDISPVGIGNTWRRLLANCLLRITREEAEIVCGAYQLCGGMHTGIEARIHAILMYQKMRSTPRSEC